MASKTTVKTTGIAFGRKLVHASMRKLEYSVTDDEKAFEIRFGTAVAAGVGSPSFAGLKRTKAPIGTAVFTAVISATGKDVAENISLNGFFVAQRGTSVTVVAMANGHQISRQFRNSQDDKGFVLSVPVRARSMSEIRLAVMLMAEQEGGVDSSALVAITDIGCETFKPRKPGPKPRG